MTSVNEPWQAERARLEQELRRARRLGAIAQLAAGVAHDCNNLLTAIQGYSELLLARLPADEPARADIEDIARAATRGAALTRQLLTFGSGDDRDAVSVDLSELARGLETLLRRMLGDTLELRMTLARDRLPVEVDPGQLEQVVLNLVLNARDAAPEGGVVAVETDALVLEPGARPGGVDLAAGRYACLRVHDTGEGMTPDVLEHAFEPFFSTKSRDRGSGLGLATARAIVEQFGGAIALASQPGAGTTASVYLPLGGRLAEART